jgi:Helix-turn-helix.
MGRRSTKENKTIWQTTREELDLTREKAAELIPGFSPERIEKIENGRTQIQPEDALLLSRYYRAPSLLNYYCCNECPIGEVHAVRTESKELAQIAVETLNAVNRMSRSKDRLLEIAEDGRVRTDEYEDFMEIKNALDRIAQSVQNLQLWMEEQIAMGKFAAQESTV